MRRRLRVGVDGRVLVSPQMRGLTRYTVNLLRALSADDHLDLVLLCHGRPHHRHLEGITAKLVVAPAEREWRWHLQTLPTLIRREELDAFHAPADRGLPWHKVCPEVVTVHGSFERAHWRECHTSTKQRAWYWAHELTNYFRADRVVAVSVTAAEEMARLRVARRSSLRTIPLAAAPEFGAHGSPEERTLLSRLGVRLPYLLFVGGYEPNKNIECAVEAFNLLAEPEVQLVVVADPQWRHASLTQQWKASLPAYARMAFLAVDPTALPALYRHALACVVSSRWESFGLPIVEAMASGTPVLSSNAHALPETAGDAALYFDPGSVEELAELMRAVVGSASLRSRLTAAGLSRAAQFTWQRVAQLTAAVYDEVVVSDATHPARKPQAT